ncbi:MAG: hypothetical protein Q7R35_03055 [Elusimicrobiota bacterium]|nr:hypothetical protein [Elusimicrobiota bacterium]
MKKALAILAGLIAGIAALVILVLFLLQQVFHDVPPPNDADLRPKASAAPGADSAYNDFVKITAKLQLSPAERELMVTQEKSKTPDLAAIGPLVARNADALGLFSDFSRRTQFSDPNYLDPARINFETPVPQFSPVVSAARLSSLRGAALLRQGRAPKALEEALGIMDAGQTLLRSDQPLISALVGMLIGNIGASRAREVINSGRLDKAWLLYAARRALAYRGGAAALQSGFRFEYISMTSMLAHLPEAASNQPNSRLVSVGARSRYLYQPEQTRGLFAARFRLLVEDAAKPCLQARQPGVQLQSIDLRPNMVGRILFNVASPQYEKLYTRRCESDFQIAAAAVEAALAAYRLEHKRYPAGLDELVPRYLAFVPADPFTGAALLYSPGTGEVHTAGKGVDGEAL